jgi:hypothetical protein
MNKYLNIVVAILFASILFYSCGSDDESTEPSFSCSDGIQNGDETGIDCGGECLECQETYIENFNLPDEETSVRSIKTLSENIFLFGTNFQTGISYLAVSDKKANLIWENTLDLNDDNIVLLDAVEASNGDFILVGLKGAFNSSSLLIVRVDSAGELLWRKALFQGEGARGFQIVKALDGGYIILFNISFSDKKIIKIDENGDLLWEKEYPENSFSTIIPNNEGYLLGGFLNATSENKAQLTKINLEGVE